MPTVLDLVGLCGDWAVAGHSLLDKRPDAATALSVRDGNIAFKDAHFSLYLPAEGSPLLYLTDDLPQKHDVASRFPRVVSRMAAQARALVRLNDSLIEQDRIPRHESIVLCITGNGYKTADIMTGRVADGVILQPIDNLLDLMRRDKRLCRREVSVMWPMSLLDALLKSIAPPTLKAKAVPLPRLEDVEAALTHKAGRMLVFKGPGRPVQSAVVAVHQSCWSDEDDIAVEQLRARVRRAYGQGAFERVVGMVTID